MTMAIDDRRIDDETAAVLHTIAHERVISIFAPPADIVHKLIEAGLAEMTAGGGLALTSAGRVAAGAMTPEAKQLRLAVAFGKGISEGAKRALAAIAQAGDDEVVALAEEIHALSVAAASKTPAQSHLEEWIT